MDVKNSASATAKASVVNFEGNTVNLGGTSETVKEGIAGLMRYLAPAARAKSEAKAREITLESYIKSVKRLEEAFPVMSECRAAMAALGYLTTDEQADNIAEVVEIAESITGGGGEIKPLLPASRDAIVEGAKKAYDDDVRALWARILAEETREPGTYSRYLLDLLARIDSSQASMFSKLCTYLVELYAGDGVGANQHMWLNPILVRDKDVGTFNEGGFTLTERGVCDSLGLIDSSLCQNRYFEPGFALPFSVGERVALLENRTDNKINLVFNGAVLLPLGEELAELCEWGTAENLPRLFEKMATDAGLTVNWYRPDKGCLIPESQPD